MYPHPIMLKFEKIYQPFIMVSKKRYVGHKYENISETEPVLEGKGVEIARRDGCIGGRKIMKKCLEILF